MTEKEMVEDYYNKITEKENLDKRLKELNFDINLLKEKIIEDLTERNAKSTAKYSSIGYISLAKDRIHASYDKENEEEIFNYLRDKGYESLIKLTVHHTSFSKLISELIENGEKFPANVKFFLEPQIKFYKQNKGE